MSEEIKINKLSGSITFANNGIAFSQFGIAKEILDLIEDLQQRVECLQKGIEDYIEELSWVNSTDEELRNAKIINKLKKIIKESKNDSK